MAERLIDAGNRCAFTTSIVKRPAARGERRDRATPSGNRRNLRGRVPFVAGPQQIREVILGDAGLLAQIPATTIIDLSTIHRAQSADREAALAKGVHYLDAPVSGGRVGARAGNSR